MIQMYTMPDAVITYGTREFEEFERAYRESMARSLNVYEQNGHEWCWGLVGSIKMQQEYGEDHEIRPGTKHFSGGTKVYIAPFQWSDGGENMVVIGVPRYAKRCIEIVIRSKNIENYRIKKVYKPEIIKLMCSSKYYWWNDTDYDKEQIMEFLKYWNPKEVEKL